MNDVSKTIQRDLKQDDLILIAGAGGFIGGSLVRYFYDLGYTRIRAVDKKPLSNWYQRIPGVENLCLDLSGATSVPAPWRMPSKSITWQRIWAGWVSSSVSVWNACARLSSIRTCSKPRTRQASTVSSFPPRPVSIISSCSRILMCGR